MIPWKMPKAVPRSAGGREVGDHRLLRAFREREVDAVYEQPGGERVNDALEANPAYTIA